MRTGSTRRSGFTLIEVVLAASLLALMLLSIAITTESAGNAHDAGSARERLDVDAHRALEFVIAELSSARRGALVPEPDPVLVTDTLTYEQSAGWLDDAPQWNDPEQIVFEIDVVELDNGLDDDGDGLVDEGRLVWYQNPGTAEERRVVKCHGVRGYLQGETPDGTDENGNGLVDERGLVFTIDGDVLTVQLTLERASPSGELITKTVRGDVRIRN